MYSRYITDNPLDCHSQTELDYWTILLLREIRTEPHLIIIIKIYIDQIIVTRLICFMIYVCYMKQLHFWENNLMKADFSSTVLI